MRPRGVLAGSFLTVAATIGWACLRPTQITVRLTTDVPCTSLMGTSIYNGSGADGVPVTTTRDCVEGAPHTVGHALLRAALDCGDPVVYLEHKTLWGERGAVDASLRVEIGRAATLRAGRHLTLVSWSRQVQVCAQACEQLALQGIEAELIDLRSLWPWDRDAVLASCAKTGRLLVVHEAVQVAGFGAETASAAEATGCRVRRLGAPRIPVGYAAVLEAQSRIGADAVAAAARRLLD